MSWLAAIGVLEEELMKGCPKTRWVFFYPLSGVCGLREHRCSRSHMT